MTLSFEDQDVDWKKHYIWCHDYASFTFFFPQKAFQRLKMKMYSVRKWSCKWREIAQPGWENHQTTACGAFSMRGWDFGIRDWVLIKFWRVFSRYHLNSNHAEMTSIISIGIGKVNWSGSQAPCITISISFPSLSRKWEINHLTEAYFDTHFQGHMMSVIPKEPSRL